jgi:hypothetical protein
MIGLKTICSTGKNIKDQIKKNKMIKIIKKSHDLTFYLIRV